MAIKKEKLTFSSSWQRFKGIRKFKKEHRKVRVVNKGINVSYGQGYKFNDTYIYWAEVQYED